ncbi:hypothetical protein HK101_005200, partial [Irineochytrium annulatum]
LAGTGVALTVGAAPAIKLGLPGASSFSTVDLLGLSGGRNGAAQAGGALDGANANAINPLGALPAAGSDGVGSGGGDGAVGVGIGKGDVAGGGGTGSGDRANGVSGNLAGSAGDAGNGGVREGGGAAFTSTSTVPAAGGSSMGTVLAVIGVVIVCVLAVVGLLIVRRLRVKIAAAAPRKRRSRASMIALGEVMEDGNEDDDMKDVEGGNASLVSMFSPVVAPLSGDALWNRPAPPSTRPPPPAAETTEAVTHMDAPITPAPLAAADFPFAKVACSADTRTSVASLSANSAGLPGSVSSTISALTENEIQSDHSRTSEVRQQDESKHEALANDQSNLEPADGPQGPDIVIEPRAMIDARPPAVGMLRSRPSMPRLPPPPSIPPPPIFGAASCPSDLTLSIGGHQFSLLSSLNDAPSFRLFGSPSGASTRRSDVTSMAISDITILDEEDDRGGAAAWAGGASSRASKIGMAARPVSGMGLGRMIIASRMSKMTGAWEVPRVTAAVAKEIVNEAETDEEVIEVALGEAEAEKSTVDYFEAEQRASQDNRHEGEQDASCDMDLAIPSAAELATGQQVAYAESDDVQEYGADTFAGEYTEGQQVVNADNYELDHEVDAERFEETRAFEASVDNHPVDQHVESEQFEGADHNGAYAEQCDADAQLSGDFRVNEVHHAPDEENNSALEGDTDEGESKASEAPDYRHENNREAEYAGYSVRSESAREAGQGRAVDAEAAGVYDFKDADKKAVDAEYIENTVFGYAKDEAEEESLEDNDTELADNDESVKATLLA